MISRLQNLLAKKKIKHFPIGIYVKPENPNNTLYNFGVLPTLIESKRMLELILKYCVCYHCANFWIKEYQKY